jgi:hypothetical protein
MYSKCLLLLFICITAIQVQAACNCESGDNKCFEQCGKVGKDEIRVFIFLTFLYLFIFYKSERYQSMHLFL